jgi:hypothetical protein
MDYRSLALILRFVDAIRLRHEPGTQKRANPTQARSIPIANG